MYNTLKEGEKVRIVFIYQVASFWPSWATLVDFCMKDDRFDAKILLLREHGQERNQMNTAESFIKMLGIKYIEFDEFDIDDFCPHYAVYQTPYESFHRYGCINSWTAMLKRKGARVVYIPYGIEIADTKSAYFAHFNNPVVMNSYRVYTISEEMRKEYVKNCLNHAAVRAIGLPKFDGLVNSEELELQASIKARISNRFIVLWKVHFPKKIIEDGISYQVSPDIREYIKFLKIIKNNPDIFFIFCPHPKFTDVGDDNTKMLTALLVELLGNFENVWVDMDDDYRPALVAADAIIVDRSSIMVEAAVSGVPVLYMRNEHYDEPLTEAIRRLISSYYQGTNVNDMNSFIDMIKEKKDPMKRKRVLETQKAIPFLDGKSGERIANDLIESLYTDDVVQEFDLKNKNIVIWGAGRFIKRFYLILHYLEMKGCINIINYVDSSKEKEGTSFQEKKVLSPQMLSEVNFDYIVVGVEEKYHEIHDQIIELGIEESKIMNYDQFAVRLMLL